MYSQIFTDIYIYLHVFIYIYIHLHVFTYIYIYLHIYTYVHVYIYIHIYIIVYNYVFVYICLYNSNYTIHCYWNYTIVHILIVYSCMVQITANRDLLAGKNHLCQNVVFSSPVAATQRVTRRKPARVPQWAKSSSQERNSPFLEVDHLKNRTGPPGSAVLPHGLR